MSAKTRQAVRQPLGVVLVGLCTGAVYNWLDAQGSCQGIRYVQATRLRTHIMVPGHVGRWVSSAVARYRLGVYYGHADSNSKMKRLMTHTGVRRM